MAPGVALSRQVTDQSTPSFWSSATVTLSEVFEFTTAELRCPATTPSGSVAAIAPRTGLVAEPVPHPVTPTTSIDRSIAATPRSRVGRNIRPASTAVGPFNRGSASVLRKLEDALRSSGRQRLLKQCIGGP